MKKGKKPTPLRRAVEWLKNERKLARDNDLMGLFNLSKSTISGYLSGKASPEFETEFEKKFGISLKDFQDEPDTGTKNHTPLSQGEKHTIESLLANNRLLGEAFLRQASAQEKEAEARIVQAQANRFWAEMNNKMMGKMINSGGDLKNYAIPSLAVDKVSTFLADKYGLDRDAVAVELGNIAFGDAFQGKGQGNNADSDKQRK